MKKIKQYKSNIARNAGILELRRRGYNDFKLFKQNNFLMLEYFVNPNVILLIKESLKTI